MDALLIQEQILIFSNGFQVFLALACWYSVIHSHILVKVKILYTLWLGMFLLLRTWAIPNQNIEVIWSILWLISNSFSFIIPIVVIVIFNNKIRLQALRIKELEKWMK